ncbi:Uncharacterised protein [Mesomycoplasma hyorhinis]|nr:Uncharacterised protein [Mesomycoplasma hyorhinis]
MNTRATIITTQKPSVPLDNAPLSFTATATIIINIEIQKRPALTIPRKKFFK